MKSGHGTIRNGRGRRNRKNIKQKIITGFFPFSCPSLHPSASFRKPIHLFHRSDRPLFGQRSRDANKQRQNGGKQMTKKSDPPTQPTDLRPIILLTNHSFSMDKKKCNRLTHSHTHRQRKTAVMIFFFLPKSNPHTHTKTDKRRRFLRPKLRDRGRSKRRNKESGGLGTRKRRPKEKKRKKLLLYLSIILKKRG